MAGACRHDCWHRATSPTTTTRVARLTSGTYGTCSGNYWFPWWFLIHNGLQFISFISTFCYTNVATEIHGFILLAAFRINPLSRSSEPWLMLGRSKKGLGSTQFFDPSPTGTMVATATANGCGILVMLMENAGLAQAAWETARAFWATPVSHCTSFLSVSSELHYFISDSYLILKGYEHKNLSFQRPYAPYASSPFCVWKHGFYQAISCCLHLGFLSAASSLEARTTTLGIVSCSCYKGGEQHGQHWAETYPGGVVINHGYNTLYIYIYM